MHRAQAAVEFLAVLAVAFLLAVLLQLSQAQRADALRSEALRLQVEELAAGTAHTLNLAGASRGYSAALELPQRLGGEPLTVTVGAQNVVVGAGSITSSRAVRALGFQNATSGTPFSLAPGSYRAVNTDGIVKIS